MRKSWFEPKRYGYGAGLPVSWEGWAAYAVFIGALVSVIHICRVFFSGGMRVVIILVAVAALTLLFIPIAKARTEGGWRWRSGKD